MTRGWMKVCCCVYIRLVHPTPPCKECLSGFTVCFHIYRLNAPRNEGSWQDVGWNCWLWVFKPTQPFYSHTYLPAHEMIVTLTLSRKNYCRTKTPELSIQVYYHSAHLKTQKLLSLRIMCTRMWETIRHYISSRDAKDALSTNKLYFSLIQQMKPTRRTPSKGTNSHILTGEREREVKPGDLWVSGVFVDKGETGFPKT